jgi:transposase
MHLLSQLNLRLAASFVSLAFSRLSSDLHDLWQWRLEGLQWYLCSAPWPQGRGIRTNLGSWHSWSLPRPWVTGPSYEQLLLELQHLRERLAERDRVIARLEAANRDLQARLDAAEQSGKRQAAPFSKGKPKPEPKTPGRKSGDAHGRHGHRPAPRPDAVDETYEARLPDQCPDCGGDVAEDRLDEQYQTEIPRKPIVRKFNIHCGRCRCCGRVLRGRHDLQTGDATGAARSQLGPDAQAAIVYLNKHAGLSHGKIAAAFGQMFGIGVSRGACAQVVLRAGQELKPAYHEIEDRLRNSRYLTPDETGWRVGGHPVWLHGWVGDGGATLFVIDPRRSADRLEGVIGRDWSGTLTHDGYSTYNRFGEAVHQQCVDHALRRARKLTETQSGMAKRFPLQVADLLGEALGTRTPLTKSPADADARGRVYDEYVDRLRDLTDRPRQNAENETFATHLNAHASSWFAFLLDPEIPATNHRAEQALRVPIVNRKVWGGNRTAAGAEAQEVTSSVLATCHKRKLNPFTFVSQALRGLLGSLFGPEGR